MKPYIAQIRSNLRLMVRDRAVLFFSFLFPLSFFFMFAQAFHASASAGAMSQVIAMVLIIGVLGNGFFGAGMRTVQDRETGVLRRFKVAPISPAPVIVASMVSGLVAYLPTVFLFLFFGKTIYHAPYPAQLGSLIVFVSIGLVAFRAVGMIVASVVNSAQEAQIVIQILYLPMLLLSGATFPVSIMPDWVQTIAQFLPATYLFQGITSILLGGESVFKNLVSVAALLITLAVGLLIGMKLFRWEKEEKIAKGAKWWILAVLAPFFLMGVYQTFTKQNIEKAKVLERNAWRRRSELFQHVKIFVGNGGVVEDGAVLVKNGKIAQVWRAPVPDGQSLDATVVESSGKTLLPGLIDMQVYIGAPGGIYRDAAKYADPGAPYRRLAAYLYSGITAVRGVGDWLSQALAVRAAMNADKYDGARFFSCGPLFMAEGDDAQSLIRNLPKPIQAQAREQLLRLPKSPAEARAQVDTLARAKVDCIKAVLDSGSSLAPDTYAAIVDEAAKNNLPSVTHTGSAADVKCAANAGTNAIEQGSTVDPIPASTFAVMKSKSIAYEPALSASEAAFDFKSGNPELLNRSLLQQAGPADLIASTREATLKNRGSRAAASSLPMASQNLLKAFQAGVTLIAGSGAGSTLVLHGPTIQHELELWVKAGIPRVAALEAATGNAASALRVDDRIGLVKQGYQATFILLDGDPLDDISNLQHINSVYFRGGRIDRSQLFDQFKP